MKLLEYYPDERGQIDAGNIGDLTAIQILADELKLESAFVAQTFPRIRQGASVDMYSLNTVLHDIKKAFESPLLTDQEIRKLLQARMNQLQSFIKSTMRSQSDEISSRIGPQN